MKQPRNIIKNLTLVSSMLIALSACNGDDGAQGPVGDTGPSGPSGMDGNDGAPSFPSARFYLSNNGSGNAGSVDIVDQYGTTLKTLMPGNNEGVMLDKAGNLIQAGDITNGSIRTFCAASSRKLGATFEANRDRDLTGMTTGLNNPKGIHLAKNSGLLMIADFTGSRISVFGSAASEDAPPLAEVTTTAAPWDLDYDEINDRLYVALVNGTVAVYDDFVSSGFSMMPNRTITPSDDMMSGISVNIHGIVYSQERDSLLLSDVGDASSAEDGALFVISNASVADGNTVVARHIAGPSTMLGNPVDIVLTGSTLRIAEKSNDAILVYSNIFAGDSGDIAPDFITATNKPESLVEIPESTMYPDISDTEQMPNLLGLAVSSNPSSEGSTTGEIGRFSTALNSQAGMFNNGMSIESVSFDLTGDSYATFDNPMTSMGGIVVGNRVATSRDSESFNLSRDRLIMGENTGLIAPKGLDISSHKGLIFVAENNPDSPSIRVFSTCASGNVMPLMTLVPSDGARPWDVDYDAKTDRAFLALTNGTIAVFDEVTTKMASGTDTIVGEDRLITPSSGGAPIPGPTNIHGIDYDPMSDSLIVSDVGSAASATDGKIFVIPGSGDTQGMIEVSVNIQGPSTSLGNPVDIMFDGKNLYVAEKSNNMILRYDNIINSNSGDLAADAMISYTAPESVAILPSYLRHVE